MAHSKKNYYNYSMESIFDRLASEIGKDERRNMLSKITASLKKVEKSPVSNETENAQPISTEKEYESFSFLKKMIIAIIEFFSTRSKDEIIQDRLMLNLQRQIEKKIPGLIDFQQKKAGPKLHKYIMDIQEAMKVFKEPLRRALEDDKKSFYAFLGQLEFEDIQTRLETEADPKVLNDVKPEKLRSEIKKIIAQLLNDVFSNIAPNERKKINDDMHTLALLRTLTYYPYPRITAFFPLAEKGGVGSAQLKDIRRPLLEIGDSLHAFKVPPSPKLLEAVFVYYFYNSIMEDNQGVEEKMSSAINKASKVISQVQRINSKLQWGKLLKLIAGDIQYIPKDINKGDDWFKIYRDFWADRLEIRFTNWAKNKQLSIIKNKLCHVWEIESIPPLPRFTNADFPENFQPSHIDSISAISAFFELKLREEHYKTLTLIKNEGKFYKIDNRREYDTIYTRFMQISMILQSFIMRFEANGEFGIKHKQIEDFATVGQDVSKEFERYIRAINTESLSLLVSLLNDIAGMSRLIKGILEGYGGSYDSLSNLDKVGGVVNPTFMDNLNEMKHYMDSVELINELVKIEEIYLI